MIVVISENFTLVKRSYLGLYSVISVLWLPTKQEEA